MCSPGFKNRLQNLSSNLHNGDYERLVLKVNFLGVGVAINELNNIYILIIDRFYQLTFNYILCVWKIYEYS